MTIELSHGKARPTLPRSGDLQLVGAEGEPNRNRAEGGRFAPGNDVGRGRGWKRAVAKMIGREVADPIAAAVAEDAWRLFSAAIREMPSDGATVRGLIAMKARHDALAGFWTAQAVDLGLATAKGIEAQELATKHGVRAERLAVTALDIATKLAAAERRRGYDPHAELERILSRPVAPATTASMEVSQPRLTGGADDDQNAPACPLGAAIDNHNESKEDG